MSAFYPFREGGLPKADIVCFFYRFFHEGFPYFESSFLFHFLKVAGILREKKHIKAGSSIFGCCLIMVCHLLGPMCVTEDHRN